MATPDTRSSLVVTKTMTYKGSTVFWSNRYHVTGPETITLEEFEVLADAVTAAEQDALTGDQEIVEVTWSDASTATSTNPHGLVTQTKTYALSGTTAPGDALATPGDCATFIRYSTDARSTKNHPIYLFNYYHGPKSEESNPVDILHPTIRTRWLTYGTAWLAGFSDGTNTRVRCGPRGANATAREVPEYITHRDFPT